MNTSRSPLLISFSGLDGAGKTTQIDNLRATLTAAALTSCVLAFWDDVVVWTRYREGFVHRVYGSERGIGAPGKPVNRRDKNVRSWYLTLSRHALYVLDAVHLRIVVRRALRSHVDVVIFDRYLYDELANLPLQNPASRAFARLLNRLIPRPDIAFILDADPEAAVARKPEYPVDFMRKCRQAYYALESLLGTLTVVPPLPLAEATAWVVQRSLAALGRSHQVQPAVDPAPAA